MNWNDLPVFLAIADSGTLAGAARNLGLNHSTVFRRLNSLEEDMNARLFDRLPEGYSLTPAGERLRELASEADETFQQINRELVGQDLLPSGKVRVTSALNITRTILAGAVPKIRKAYPGIVLELAAGESDYDLNRREADIALRATLSPPQHLVGRKLLDLNWWLCRSCNSRAKKPGSVAELSELKLIGADAELMRLPVFQWLEKEHGSSVVARSNDLSTMAAMAIAGVGYAVLPSDNNEKGLEKVLKIPNAAGELWILTHPDLRNVARIKVVWDALVEHIAELEQQ